VCVYSCACICVCVCQILLVTQDSLTSDLVNQHNLCVRTCACTCVCERERESISVTHMRDRVLVCVCVCACVRVCVCGYPHLEECTHSYANRLSSSNHVTHTQVLR